MAIKKITPMSASVIDAKHTLREIRLLRYLGRHENVGRYGGGSLATPQSSSPHSHTWAFEYIQSAIPAVCCFVSVGKHRRLEFVFAFVMLLNAAGRYA